MIAVTEIFLHGGEGHLANQLYERKNW